MGSVANWWWRRLAGVVVVLVLLTVADQVASQSLMDRNNTLIRDYCSLYNALNRQYFLSNLNNTLSNLRRQLSGERKLYAVARTVINGESVWGLAACRDYVSNRRCLACFDTAVARLKQCNISNGAHAFYDDCDLRYENNNFYAEANLRAPVIVCGNDSASQPTQFRKTAERLLSDLRKAAPRTTNFYAASTRKVGSSNATVYAFAQCNLNLSQTLCAQCLNVRYTTVGSCLPGTSGKAIDNGCFMRYSGTPFFGLNQTTDLKPFLNGDSSNSKVIIGGVVGGVIGFFLLILVFLLWRRRSRKSSDSRKVGASTGATDLLQGPIAYDYNDLKTATNNFDEHKLGGGEHGEVYKGILNNGDVVAIKRTTMASRRGNTSFQDQLMIISNVHHRHLIRLLGYCIKGPHLFLVVEYMENGSLDKFLYGEKRGSLNWKQRFDIIFGTAKGLAYLHEQYHVTIIHRDIKSSNILLDNELQPRISDFGLIRLLPEDKTHISTKFAGTLYSGSVAPEYAIHGQLSEKVDTYSFGIVVLEIISGKRYSDTQNLLDQAWNLYESGNHLNLIDDTLDTSEYVEEDAKKIIEIALMCTQSSVSVRPTMSEVVTLLTDKVPEERMPIRPSFADHDVKINIDASTSYPSYASNASVSTTIDFVP